MKGRGEISYPKFSHALAHLVLSSQVLLERSQEGHFYSLVAAFPVPCGPDHQPQIQKVGSPQPGNEREKVNK